ncbi:hypothetical protein PVK06_018384 [Gossypium arboreum]|uniref:Uncharacterized protein n=1 Tax=Gossypium arboreum TaxID=29729 RepID=A0ABR0Q6J8_GOSAR|nr:hypothetical protein PVK06_018384 [Gossypium arboreum]
MQPSNVFSDVSKYSSCVKFRIDNGIGPDKLEWKRSNNFKDTRFPIESGDPPQIFASEIIKYSKDDKFVIETDNP